MTYEAMTMDADMDEPDIVFKTCWVKFRHENENKQRPFKYVNGASEGSLPLVCR